MAALVTLACCAAGLAPAPARAQTQSCARLAGGATLCGATDTVVVSDTARFVPVYRGIPYAKGPVGTEGRRWQPPQDTTLTGSVSATRFGPICPQKPSPTNPQPQSEACLYLNVWTPPALKAPVPVMVFIHGGAFVEGSGSSALYNGAYLAASGNVVVVTLNYRLGALGFLRYVGDTGGPVIRGNLGLLDQQKALQWVQTNVAAFGGDPAQVTIFGESAGAMSVGFHLFAVPTSTGLFQAAIMESNPMGYQYRTTAQAQADGATFMSRLCTRTLNTQQKCRTDAGWAQSASLDAIRDAGEFFMTGAWGRLKSGGIPEALAWTPLVDDTLVTGQPYRGYAANMPAKPYVFGMNADEGVIFAAMAEKLLGITLSPAVYDTMLTKIFGEKNQATIVGYPTTSTTKPYQAKGHATTPPLDPTASTLAQVITDFAFDCGNLVAADATVAVNQAKSLPVYGYLFAQKPFFNLYPDSRACTADAGHVCHAYELPYVFNTLAYADTVNTDAQKSPPRPVTPADVAVSRDMAKAWTSFANAPKSAPNASWTAYTPGGRLYVWTGSSDGKTDASHMQTASDPTLSSSAYCPLWKTMPPYTARQ